MWRIIPVVLLLLSLTASAAAAEIERNPHSRSGAGIEEGQEPSRAEAETAQATEADEETVSLAERYAVAISIVTATRGAAAQLLASQLAQSVDNASGETADSHSNIGNIPAGNRTAEPAPQSAESSARAETAASAALPNAEPETEPAATPAVSLDDLVAAISRRDYSRPEQVQIENQPVVDGEAAADAPQAEPTITSATEDVADPGEPDSPVEDQRRPDLKLRIHDYSDGGQPAEASSVDDQLELGGEDGEAQPAESTAEAEAQSTDEAAGEATPENSETSDWVRAAPPERARPQAAPSRHWDYSQHWPQHPPVAPDQLPADEEALKPEEAPSDRADDGAVPAQATGSPQTVGFLDSASLTAGLMLAPVSQADREARQSATAPVEPVLGDFSPHMPDYDISDRITTVARGNARRKQVALTFDDGPHPEFTSQILAVLDQYDVPATFFFVGVQAQKYPHWVKMVHQEGHEIGSHTYDHFRLPKMPRQEKIYQIDEYQRLVEGLTGETPRFLRPPGGQVDAETQQLLADRHMLLALWDVALNDTREDKTSEMIYKTARSEIRSGSVVLLHDGIQATVDMLPELITQLKNQGFEFVTMSELAAGM